MFEIRYPFGHVYLDRCGQTLVDIERECEGWIAAEANPQGTIINRPDKDYVVRFNTSEFNFTARRAFRIEIKEIVKEISMLWRIVQANLNLDEFIAIICRLFYILPTRSIEDSERVIKKSKLNIQYPNTIVNGDYEIITRHPHTTIKKMGVEYILNFTGMRRAHGLDPSKLALTDPRTLPKHQREARLAELKRVNEYSINPMYGIQLDVECIIYEPDEDISVEDFILAQHAIFMTDFFPIIGEL